MLEKFCYKLNKKYKFHQKVLVKLKISLFFFVIYREIKLNIYSQISADLIKFQNKGKILYYSSRNKNT
jgi:hypothetical protein